METHNETTQHTALAPEMIDALSENFKMARNAMELRPTPDYVKTDFDAFIASLARWSEERKAECPNG